MKRLIWILVIAAAVFSLNEVRTKGIEGAFGGALSGKLEPLQPAGTIDVPDNALE